MPAPGQFIPKQLLQLPDVAALSPVADRLMYFTSASALGLATLTALGRSLIDDGSASDARTTLGLGTAAILNTPVGVTVGGTGLTAITSGHVLYASGADTIAGGTPDTAGLVDKSTAQTITGAKVLETGASGGTPVIFRQTGGVAGTDQLEISDNGTVSRVYTRQAELHLGVYGVTKFIVANNAMEMNDGTNSYFYCSNTITTRRSGDIFGWAASATNAWSGVDTALGRFAITGVTIHDNAATGNPALAFQAKSSTTNLQDRFRITTAAISNVHAARQYSTAIDVYNFNGACRVISMSAPASGTAAMIGFLGAPDVVRQPVAVAASDAATTQSLANDLRTALINLGLAV